MAIASGGEIVAGADRIAVPRLAVDLAAGVAVDHVVTHEHDRPIGYQMKQDESSGAYPNSSPDHGAREKTR